MMRCLVRLLLALQSSCSVLAGVCLVTAGGLYGAERFGDWDGSELDVGAAISIGLGGVLFLLGLLGLLTSCSRSYSWSYCFSIILLVIVILQCFAGVLVIFFRNEIEKVVDKSLRQSMRSYHLPDPGDSPYQVTVRNTWDGIQNILGCCGVMAFTDWSDTEFGTPGLVPESCCKEVVAGCGSDIDFGVDNPDLHQTGCVMAVQGEMAENIEMVVAVIAGLLAVQVLGVCLSCCLARSVQVEHCDL
eukprot:GFUD01047081.1.p1 GENE.GFUD01047081.1~~GFUD01047081.1.p1  ORF type:complete len:245 (-),score=76.53 GFUD01047081.1:159-893(-)